MIVDRAAGTRGRLVGLLVLHAALLHFNRISISVAGSERLMPDYGISATRMGVVYSAYLVAYTLMMMPGGWLIDGAGARAALMLVAFGSALFVGLTGVAGLLFKTAALLIPALLVIRILQGVTNAPFHPGAAFAVSRWIPAPQRGGANGLVNCSALLGISATYFAFGFLMDRLGWPGAFLVASGVTLAAAAAWAALSPGQPESGVASGAASRSSGIPPWRKRSVILLTVSYAAVGYFQYMFFYWMEYYFGTTLHLGPARGRLFATIPTVAMAFGMAAGGGWIDRAQARWGARRGRAVVSIAGMAGSAALLGAGIFCREPAWVVTCFSLALASLGTCEGAFWTTATDLGGTRGGLSAAIVNTGGNAGGVLAPLLTPLVSDRYGWPVGLGLACLFCFLGAVTWVWIDPDEGESGPPPESLQDGGAVPTVS